MTSYETVLDTPTRINIVLASIAEPGDGTLGRVLAEYDSTPVGRRLMISDLINDDLPLRDVADQRELREGIARWLPRVPSAEQVLRIEKRMGELGIWSMGPSDNEWPVQLFDLGVHAPRVLFGRGSRGLLAEVKPIAVVGARAATGYGEHVAGELTDGLVQRGYATVSGGAYGIDGMVHRATLAAGGTTIAFLAGGVDRYYPTGHEQLLTRVAEEGVVVSEVEPGAAPTKWRFLQRNRLIAALGLGTLVVEAGHRSGSLNTAGHAAALGRPLMAVPGPITSPASAGCHRIIRETGATLVTSATEVIERIEA